MITTDHREVLALFNEKVAKLGELSFAKEVGSETGGAIVEYSAETGWESVFVGPSEETIAPVVLTLRFFIQDNERISISSMRDLYQNADVSAESRTAFIESADHLNAELDTPTNIGIEEGRNLTYRDVLKIFVYGEYAHANRAKRKTYRELQGTPFFPILQNDFVVTLMFVIRVLHRMADLNKQILAFADVHDRAGSDA